MSSIDLSTAVTTIGGVPSTLDEYAGGVLLIVNTASYCGFTPQFEGLEELWRDYRDRGLYVLGFPCNQFGKQDPKSNSEIADFCAEKYDVTFPMFAKIEVNGPNSHPLFESLKSAAPGLLGTKAIKWNFTKFLVARDGGVLGRFGPKDTPAALRAAIEAAL